MSSKFPTPVEYAGDFNDTVYAALNQCKLTGLETLLRQTTTPDASVIRLYRDHRGWHRIVAFKSAAHKVGYSGVLVQSDGEIHYKETCKAMRGRSSTKQLQAMLTKWGVQWYPSPYQTTAGAACYK